MIGYGVLIGLPSLAIAAAILAQLTHWASVTHVVAWITSFASATFWAAALISWPMMWVEYHSWPEQRDAIQQTLNDARQDDSGRFELATIQRDAMKYNKELAKTKAMQPYWKPFIPEVVHTVEPVR